MLQSLVNPINLSIVGWLKLTDGFVFYYTTIYASNGYQERRTIWEHLSKIKANVSSS